MHTKIKDILETIIDVNYNQEIVNNAQRALTDSTYSFTQCYNDSANDVKTQVDMATLEYMALGLQHDTSGDVVGTAI